MFIIAWFQKPTLHDCSAYRRKPSSVKFGRARQASIFTPNEIRGLENKNDLDGGDDLFAPLNSNRSDAST